MARPLKKVKAEPVDPPAPTRQSRGSSATSSNVALIVCLRCKRTSKDKDWVPQPGREDACGVCFTAVTAGFDLDFAEAMSRYNSSDKANKSFARDIDRSCERLAKIDADEEMEYFDPPSSVKAVQSISESMVVECLFLTENQVVKFIGATSNVLKLDKVNRLSECGRRVVAGFYVRFDDLPEDIREKDLLGLRRIRWELKFHAQHEKEILQPSRQLRLAQGADVLPGVAARMPDRSASNPLELLANMPTISALRKKAADLEEKRKKKDKELAAKLELDKADDPVDIVDEAEPRIKGSLSSGLGTTTIDKDAGVATRKRKKQQSSEEIKAALSHDPELCKVALKLGSVPDSLLNLTVRRALEGAKMGNQCTGATRLLEKLGDTSKEGRSLSRRIAAVQAAQLLATTSDLLTLPSDERISKYVLIGATGSPVPLLIKLKVTIAEVSQAVKGFVADGASAKLQNVVSMLILCKGTLDDEWTFTKPSFAHVMSEAMQLSGDDERRGQEARDQGTDKGNEQAAEIEAEIESRWEALAAGWVDAFANDTLLGLIPATATSSYARLLDVCSSMLTALNAQVAHIPEDFPPLMRSSIERVTAFCKCICCLAAPVPGYMDCTFRDAFVLSKYSGADYMEAEIKNAIGRKGSFWQEAFDAEQRASSAVKEFAPIIRQYVADMDKIVQDAKGGECAPLDCTAACKLVFEVLSKRDHMASHLRKGALQELDAMLQVLIPLLMEVIAKESDLKSIAGVNVEDFLKLASQVPAVGKPASGYAEALDKFATWQATNQTALQGAKLKELCQSATNAEPGTFDVALAWGVLQSVDLDGEEAADINLQPLLLATLKTLQLKVKPACDSSVGGKLTSVTSDARKDAATAKGIFQKVPMAASARKWLLGQVNLLEDCLSLSQACRRYHEIGRDAKDRDAKDSERLALDGVLKTVASLRIRAVKSKNENESLAALAASTSGAVFPEEAEAGKEDAADAAPTKVEVVCALEHACTDMARSMTDNPHAAVQEGLQFLISKQLEACKSHLQEARKLLIDGKDNNQDGTEAKKSWETVAGWKDKLPNSPSLDQVMDLAGSAFGSVDGSALRDKIAEVEKALQGMKTVQARYGPHLKHFGMQDEMMALTTGDYMALSEDGKVMAALGAEALLWYANQHTNKAIARSILGEVTGRISGDFVEETRVDKTLLAEGRRILG
ncbi:unnamed protein product [Symbiodinium microadriaticum]|nr:unnamed protein product [Symbiodinium microadriaticum]